MMPNFEIIEIHSHNELPNDVEFVLYEPPFYGEELESVCTSFAQKYGNEPKTIYRLNHQLFVLLEDE